MPNIENLKLAITVMNRVRDYEESLNRDMFNLSSFQNRDALWDTLHTEKEVVNECGTTCCFVGWLAVSPEFQELGLRFTEKGYVGFVGDLSEIPNSTEALGNLLGVSHMTAHRMIYDNGDFYCEGNEAADVTVDHVIAKLEEILSEAEIKGE